MQLSQGSKWIWVNNCPHEVNCYCEFADRFIVDRADSQIFIRISADSQYALWINERFADFGQYADYPNYKVFDTLDVTKYISVGENELRILAYYQGTDTSTYTSGTPGVIYDVISGSKALTFSSASTLSRVASEYKNGPMEMVSPQLGYTFCYNASLRGQNKWASSAVINKSVNLYQRPVAKLEIKKRAKATIVSQGFYMYHPAYEQSSPAVVMQKAFLSSARMADFTGKYGGEPFVLGARNPFVCNVDNATPFHLGENGVYVVIDLGREEAGCFEIDIDAAAETRILIGYGEHLDDLRVRTSVGNRSFAAQFICSAGRNRYTHYNKRFGCRYISLYVESFDFTLYYAGIRPCEYPFKARGKFKCSDLLHNKIYETCLRTLVLSAHEHYEDCPWREQALYSMDSRNQILCGYYAFGEYDLPRESIRLLSYGLREDGLLELCAPAKVNVTIPYFSLMWIIELYEYILFSGDVSFAGEMWPCAEKIIRTFWRNAKGHDLQQAMNEPGYWNFYEWTQGLSSGFPTHLRNKNNSRNYDGPLSVYYILALDAMIKMAKLLYSQSKTSSDFNSNLSEIDFVEKISWCEMLLSSARNAFHDTFWDSSIGAYCTYIVNGEKIHFSELMNSLALYAGLVPDNFTKRVADILSGYAICSPALIPISLSNSIFKYEALLSAGAGYSDYVIKDISDKWGNMLYKGATSFWETVDGAWDFECAGSLCHGWSAIPVVIYYKYLLGVSPRTEGFRDYSFKPIKLKTPLSATGKIPRKDRASLDVEINENGFKLT